MKMMHGAAAVVASILAMMLLAPSDAASARGSGARGFHFLGPPPFGTPFEHATGSRTTAAT